MPPTLLSDNGPTTDPLPEPFPPESGEVVEVSLLLSTGQVAALEQAAHRRGLTAAEVVRRLLGAFIRNPSVL